MVVSWLPKLTRINLGAANPIAIPITYSDVCPGDFKFLATPLLKCTIQKKIVIDPTAERSCCHVRGPLLESMFTYILPCFLCQLLIICDRIHSVVLTTEEVWQLSFICKEVYAPLLHGFLIFSRYLPMIFDAGPTRRNSCCRIWKKRSEREY